VSRDGDGRQITGLYKMHGLSYLMGCIASAYPKLQKRRPISIEYHTQAIDISTISRRCLSYEVLI
jgi:hypothetical protein